MRFSGTTRAEKRVEGGRTDFLNASDLEVVVVRRLLFPWSSLMKLYVGCCLFFLLLSSALVSSASVADETISPLQTKARAFNLQNGWDFNTRLEAGFGSFQSIKLPEEDFGFPVEGSQSAPNNRQGGLLMGLSAEVLSPYDRWQWVNQFDAAQITNQIGTPDSLDANLSWLAGESGVRFNARRQLAWDLMVRYQRSYFSNISTGHRLTTVSPKLQMSWQINHEWLLRTSVAYSLSSKFALDQGTSTDILRDTSVRNIVAGGEIHLSLNETSALAFSGRWEKADVKMESLEAYNDAGLNLIFFADKGRQLSLDTFIGSLGLVTKW